MVFEGLAAVDDGVLDGRREITQKRLFVGVVGELIHHLAVFPHLVANRIDIADLIAVGQMIGDENLVQPGDDLREQFFLAITRLRRACTFTGLQTVGALLLFQTQVLLVDP